MSRITLQDAENIVAQLSSDDQLKLIAHFKEHLEDNIPSEIDEEKWRRENAERIQAFLKLSITMSAKVTGPVDSAEDIRQIREERMSKL